MYNITVSCSEINTPAGFVYVILPVLLNQTDNPDCDQSWYSQDKRLIADPSDPQKLIAHVISVSSDRLVTSHCVNELHHEIICHSDGRLMTPSEDRLNLQNHISGSSDVFRASFSAVIQKTGIPNLVSKCSSDQMNLIH
ncbi:hypothetical protein G5714_004040 [Onychostoma macrolepis]|uniref:Uncharacterized protein n=1 Tax=Onychostoma macrolepis TaxID=369639 RepID=A0A7J6DBN6_9TELE|nr:hypothetical protein G5714_004040 [Onychostoma macrolepis]